MNVYKVLFKKSFTLLVEAESCAELRAAWEARHERGTIRLESSDWETGEWEMFTAGPAPGNPDHFLDGDGDIRSISDKKSKA